MIGSYSIAEILFYVALYSFLGWLVEVAIIALVEKRFLNRGLLNLPLKVSCGVTATLLALTLPTVRHNYVFQAILCIVVTEVVRRFSELFSRGIGDERFKRELIGRGRIAMRLAFLLAISLVYLLLALIVHPVVYGLVSILPNWLVTTIGIAFAVMILADYICVRYALYTAERRQLEATTRWLGTWMTERIWQRLNRAYPGADEPSDLIDGTYTFAKGLCMDKLAWVFLISSFLGALIEMAYCFLTGGGLMSRSSVLYGPFSFVWGFGAVVLTVTLHRFIGREDRYTFLAGFVVGGAYEYLCSVFTELVFGTVFWDYSWMPLNIGGRTNVIYCIFWGILAVIWVKILYPLMERGIEKIPLLAGKILTWSLVVVMVCDGLLTASAMIRYTERHTSDRPAGHIRQMLDTHFDDAYMESRWPNMVIADAPPQPE